MIVTFTILTEKSPMNATFMPLASIQLNPIGFVNTPYDEKFSVPRQPNLVAEGKGILHLVPPYNSPDAVRGLEQFSHIWLIFQFHHIPERDWHATVRPRVWVEMKEWACLPAEQRTAQIR